MSCRLPCQVGSYCNSGGTQPYAVCVAAPGAKPGTTYWRPLPMAPVAPGSVPMCPMTADPSLPCVPGNACYVAGLDGRYRCTALARTASWRHRPPPAIGWVYEEEIKPPAIFNMFKQPCYEELPENNSQPNSGGLVHPEMLPCKRCAGHVHIYPLRKLAKRSTRNSK